MEILLTILLFVPFIVILWLANFGQHREAAGGASGRLGELESGRGRDGRLWTVLAYLILAGVYGLLILFGVALQLIGSAGQGPMASSLSGGYGEMGIDPATLSRVGLGMWLPSVFGLLLLLPFVRVLVGRVIRSFDASSPVQAIALSYCSLVAVNLMTTVGMGLGNLAKTLEAAGPMEIQPMLWAQEIVMAVMAMVGVGWLARCSFGQALKRLAVVAPSFKQAIVGTGIGVAMAILISVLELLLAKVGIATDADVQRLSEQLLGSLVKTPFGILTLGLAAALGEESVFRGALLPRFGLLLTTLLFALLHSTYGLSLATALVFLVGLVLGLVRLRANTTTSMVVHAVYNMSLGVIALLGLLQSI